MRTSGADSAASLATRPSPRPSLSHCFLFSPVLLNSSARAQALGVGISCAFCFIMLWGLAGAPDAQEAAVGTGWCCGLHNHLRSSRTWPCCLGSRIYILPTGEVYCFGLLPFLPLYYHGQLPDSAFSPSSCHPAGDDTGVPAGKLRRHWPWLFSPSH